MTLAIAPLTTDTAGKLLDFSQKMDIGLLDQVVAVMNRSTGSEQMQAGRILTELKVRLFNQLCTCVIPHSTSH